MTAPNLNDPKIPHIGNKKDLLEREAEQIREMMRKPGMAEKVAGMADQLALYFNESTKLITDIRVGAKFYDQIAKQNYAYEYITRGFPHSAIAKVVFEEAKLPIEKIEATNMYMVIYEPDSNPSPRYIINAFDFCKYFAVGIWTLIDGNNQEKEFLNEVKSS